MHLSVLLYFFFIPLSVASIFLGGRRVEVSLLFAGLLALIGLIDFVQRKIHLEKTDGWSVPFSLFIFVSTISLLLSPYLGDAYVLGTIQVLGLSVILLASLRVSKFAAGAQESFILCIRVLVLTIGVVAAIGAWQFAAFNLFDTKFFADFSRVNAFRSANAGELIWKDPGRIGEIRRANSLLTEPAVFVEVLGMICGLALIRVGIVGRALSRTLASVMPLWVAIFVLVGFVFAISILGYVLIGFTLASLLLILYKFEWRSVRRILFTGFVAAILCAVLFFSFGQAFVDKVASIPLILSAATGQVQVVQTEQISALALAANVAVVLDNLQSHPLLGIGLGGHSHAYAAHAPDWIRGQKFYGVHQMDGGSLLIRLLSETGATGTILFLGGWLTLVIRARRAIQKALTLHREDASQPSVVLALSAGVSASCVALVSVYMIRRGVYYDPPIWALIALTAAVPSLLNSKYGQGTEEKQPSGHAPSNEPQSGSAS